MLNLSHCLSSGLARPASPPPYEPAFDGELQPKEGWGVFLGPQGDVDDTEEALAKRLEAFDSNRAAIEDAFSAMAKVVDGNREKSSVWEDVKAFFSA